MVFLEDVWDEMAEELVEKCPVNVFDIEDLPKGKELYGRNTRKPSGYLPECPTVQKNDRDTPSHVVVNFVLQRGVAMILLDSVVFWQILIKLGV